MYFPGAALITAKNSLMSLAGKDGTVTRMYGDRPAIATGAMIKLFGQAGVAYAAVAMTLLVVIFGEVLDGTEAELVADPAISETAHELEVHAAPGNAALKLGGRDVPPDGDPVDYTTFSLMRILKRRQARVMI